VSVHRVTRCRSCGGEIIWAETLGGKMTPVDAHPITGLVTLIDRGDGVPPGQLMPPNQNFHMSHWKTCANAEEHRKRAKPAETEVDTPGLFD
jgi:hypothetical protein